MNPTRLRTITFLFMLIALCWGGYGLIGTAFAKSMKANTQSIVAGQASGPSLSVAGGLSVHASHSITVPIAYASNGEQIAAASFSLDIGPGVPRL